ncbi:hypothetical protein [Paenibacillus sp. 22594]|uniref:hypothetical protein n=1 Tax=Paenibacillus sp. 22594 TaxID=3453947 RepID=UPI003F870F85
MEDFLITAEFGFTDEEIEAIEKEFSFSLSYEDWESIAILDEIEEEGEQTLLLATGKMVYFPDDLLRKETLAQID